ncbi:MAG: glycosyltransferase [Ardenticatenaceae bacterium]|nr:glycosyltransferase [Ardenticatenaceae bacterium]MCB9443913.1 glycosyltransferase [Ardenticatenaceae bacterium]
MMKSNPIRVIGVTMGDVVNMPAASVKYGYLFTAVAQHLSLIQTIDANLTGWNRWLNALLTFHPQRYHWQQRFYKNILAFHRRSQAVSNQISQLKQQADVVLQVGVMFDACWPPNQLPSVIYTDYTSYLSAQKPTVGRSPLSPKQRQTWFNLERQAYQRAAHICTRSQMACHSIIEHYGIPSNKITVVGGGVNFPSLPVLEPRQTDGPPTALFIGNDFYRKGGDLVLAAFAQVRKQIPDAQLLFLTRDPIPLDLLQEGVYCCPSSWSRDKIINLFHQADLFVLPSRLETWGDVLLEAMAFGLPCIGVADDAMTEIIEHEQTGLLVQPENIDELARAIMQLMSDPTIRKQYGSAARRRVEMHFTWDHVAERLAEILGPVVNAAKREIS